MPPLGSPADGSNNMPAAPSFGAPAEGTIQSVVSEVLNNIPDQGKPKGEGERNPADAEGADQEQQAEAGDGQEESTEAQGKGQLTPEQELQKAYIDTAVSTIAKLLGKEADTLSQNEILFELSKSAVNAQQKIQGQTGQIEAAKEAAENWSLLQKDADFMRWFGHKYKGIVPPPTTEELLANIPEDERAMIPDSVQKLIQMQAQQFSEVTNKLNSLQNKLDTEGKTTQEKIQMEGYQGLYARMEKDYPDTFGRWISQYRASNGNLFPPRMQEWMSRVSKGYDPDEALKIVLGDLTLQKAKQAAIKQLKNKDGQRVLAGKSSIGEGSRRAAEENIDYTDARSVSRSFLRTAGFN